MTNCDFWHMIVSMKGLTLAFGCNFIYPFAKYLPKYSGMSSTNYLLVYGATVLVTILPTHYGIITSKTSRNPTKTTPTDWILLVIRGGCSSAMTLSLLIAINLTYSSDAFALTNLSPAFVIIFTGILSRKLPDRIITASILLAVVGMILVNKPYFLFGNALGVVPDRVLGSLAATMTAVLYAVNVMISKHVVRKFSVTTFILASSVAGIMLGGVLVVVRGDYGLSCGAGRWVSSLATVLNILCTVLLYYASRHENPNVIASFQWLNVVIGYGFDLALNGDVYVFDWIKSLGTVLCVLSSFGIAVRKYKLAVKESSS